MEEQMDYDMLVKVVIVGQAGVGKSALIGRFVSGEFKKNQQSTLGVDFEFACVKVQERVVKLQIWDTAGQEKYGMLARSYLRGAHAVIFAFDPADPKTLDYHISHFLNCDAMDTAHPDAYKCLVATKGDIKTAGRDDSKLLGNLSQFTMPMMWTSAADNTGVHDVFYSIAAHCLDNHSILSTTSPQNIIKLDTTTSFGGGGNSSCKC